MRGPAITNEVIDKVKLYAAKYPTMTYEDLGIMCGTSRGSVGRILRGEYDVPTVEDADDAKHDEIVKLLREVLAGIDLLLDGGQPEIKYEEE